MYNQLVFFGNLFVKEKTILLKHMSMLTIASIKLKNFEPSPWSLKNKSIKCKSDNHTMSRKVPGVPYFCSLNNNNIICTLTFDVINESKNGLVIVGPCDCYILVSAADMVTLTCVLQLIT